MGKQLALHETLKLQELLTLKSLSLTKVTTMVGMIQDEELKQILQHEVDIGDDAIERLAQFLNNREEKRWEY